MLQQITQAEWWLRASELLADQMMAIMMVLDGELWVMVVDHSTISRETANANDHQRNTLAPASNVGGTGMQDLAGHSLTLSLIMISG